MKTTDVSFILVTYNTLDMTLACIDSIRKQTKQYRYEIIVVDNASSDGSWDVFSSMEGIVYRYNTENIGFGAANNVGIGLSSGEYVFFLNTDTLLLNDAAAYFVAYAQQHENRCVLGSWLLNADRVVTHSYGRFPSLRNALGDAVRVYTKRLGLEPSALLEGDVAVDYITGADLFVPKTVLQVVGGFDEVFFMYYEETDLQQRMARQGYERRIIPGPRIIHLENGSLKGDAATKHRSMNKLILNTVSLLTYLRKYHSSFSFRLFKPAYFALRLPAVLLRSDSFVDKMRYLRLFF